MLAAAGTAALLAAVLGMAPGDAPTRGNEVPVRTRGAIFGVEAAPRLGILVGDGRRVIQPVGFGAGLTFRVHALHLGWLRLGGVVSFGHTRFLQSNRVPEDLEAPPGEGATARRYSALGHTDFSLGPSAQLVLGPVMLEGGVGGGVGISTFVRPRDGFEEEDFSDVTGLLRGGGHLAIPIRNDQGITIGASVSKFFSGLQVVAADDLDLVDPEPNANPFDLVTDVYLGYQMWF